MVKKEVKRTYYLIFRYIILLLSGINLWLFYAVFTPLTLYPIFFLLNLFFDVSLTGNIITLNGYPSIELVKACIAGSAYYLLLILNLTTPMKIKKQILSLVFSFSAFLAINIFRIFFFSILLLKSFSLFNLTHLIFWYLLSSLIVVAIWLANIKIFRIKTIPIYSDIKLLYRRLREK